MNIDKHKTKFYEFINRDIPSENLEEWIYKNEQLEHSLPHDDYIDSILEVTIQYLI